MARSQRYNFILVPDPPTKSISLGDLCLEALHKLGCGLQLVVYTTLIVVSGNLLYML